MSASENRFGIGAGVGLRRFVTAVMAPRFEGHFMYAPELRQMLSKGCVASSGAFFRCTVNGSGSSPICLLVTR